MKTLKTKNKEELTAIAKDVFKRYPRAESVAVTSDGTAFITDESDAAVKNHSAKNRYGKKLAITEFLREEFDAPKSKTKKADSSKDEGSKGKGGSKDKGSKGGDTKTADTGDGEKSAEALIAEINADTANVESVAAIVEAETAGKKRKTVLEAANAKLETLKANL